MKQKAHGQVRRSQVITTYGPGALVDLPQESAIVAGLDEWPPPHKLDEIDEPRLARKLQAITGVATVQLLEAVIQLHRLREVMALAGFTRFEAVTPDIHGEYETDVERAAIALEPSWFPAVENRGEGLFLRLRTDAVEAWLARPAVQERSDGLARGHRQWAEKRKSARSFPDGPYVLLHTLSHLLIQSLSMQCGYPASSLRERIYAEEDRYGLLIYTGSPDAEGTLGGLVRQARRIDEHLTRALEAGGLCSNDPTCAEHAPGDSMSDRFLHGAACHGYALVAVSATDQRPAFGEKVDPTTRTRKRGASSRRRRWPHGSSMYLSTMWMSWSEGRRCAGRRSASAPAPRTGSTSRRFSVRSRAGGERRSRRRPDP